MRTLENCMEKNVEISNFLLVSYVIMYVHVSPGLQTLTMEVHIMLNNLLVNMYLWLWMQHPISVSCRRMIINSALVILLLI